MFNFTTPFSLAAITNPFPIEERGTSHMDELLYVFRFKAFDPLFRRGAAENEMKDYWTRFIVDYAKYGMKDSYFVKGCTRRAMDRGICEYLEIQRDYSKTPNTKKIFANDDFDTEIVDVYRKADRLALSVEKAGSGTADRLIG